MSDKFGGRVMWSENNVWEFHNKAICHLADDKI